MIKFVHFAMCFMNDLIQGFFNNSNIFIKQIKWSLTKLCVMKNMWLIDSYWQSQCKNNNIILHYKTCITLKHYEGNGHTFSIHNLNKTNSDRNEDGTKTRNEEDLISFAKTWSTVLKLSKGETKQNISTDSCV